MARCARSIASAQEETMLNGTVWHSTAFTSDAYPRAKVKLRDFPSRVIFTHWLFSRIVRSVNLFMILSYLLKTVLCA